MAAYREGIAQGADGLEVDVVATSDGVLVCRHEHEIGDTTDVAARAEFADRRTVRAVPGRPEVDGWFAEDFSFDELRILRCRERMPTTRPSNTAYDGHEPVPTLDEVLDLIVETRRTRPLGLLLELKQPTYLASLGLDLVTPTLAALEREGLDDPAGRVLIQCFEPTVLAELSRRTDLPLLQLLELTDHRPADLCAIGDARTYGDLLSPAGLDEMAARISMLGVHTTHVFPRDPWGATGAVSSLVQDAHERSMTVTVFTLRQENRFLPRQLWIGVDPEGAGDLAAETHAFAATGVDGLITDNPGLVLAALPGD